MICLRSLVCNDTLLMMSDRSIESQQKKSNLELKEINAWLRQNKLSLNYPKQTLRLLTNPLTNLLVQALTLERPLQSF